MNCPKCQSDNLTTVGELARCQACEHYFEPPPKAAPAPRIVPRPTECQLRTYRIRNLAGSFEMLSYLALVLGAIGFLIILFNNGLVGALIALLSTVGIYSWLTLVANVIHIRANLEK